MGIQLRRTGMRSRGRAGAGAVALLSIALAALAAAPGASAAGHMCATPNASTPDSATHCSYASDVPFVRWFAPTAMHEPSYPYVAPHVDLGEWALYVNGRCAAGTRCGSDAPIGTLALRPGSHRVDLYASVCVVHIPFGPCALRLPTAAQVQDF
jgi:hypothetical protein